MNRFRATWMRRLWRMVCAIRHSRNTEIALHRAIARVPGARPSLSVPAVLPDDGRRLLVHRSRDGTRILASLVSDE